MEGGDIDFGEGERGNNRNGELIFLSSPFLLPSNP
jgi:hypothetical protein